MRKKKAITAYRISLKEFLNTLVNLYEEGADFIDLEFIQGETQEQDVVRVYVKDEYMSDDDDEDAEERDLYLIPPDPDEDADNIPPKKSISEDDINELL